MSLLTPIFILTRIAMVSTFLISGLGLLLLVLLLGAMGIPPSELPSLAMLVIDHFTH